MITQEEIVPSTEEPIPVATPEFDDQGLKPEEFPEAAPDPFIKAEEDVTEEDMNDLSGIEIKDKDGGDIDISSPDNNTEVYLPPPPEPKLPPKSLAESKKASFYAAEELGLTQDDIEFEESRDQQFTEGRSDLEDAAAEQAALGDDESDQMAIESIISDPSLGSNLKKSALQNYLITGSVSVSLKERYMNKLSGNMDGLGYTAREEQREVSETLGNRKTELDVKIREEDVDSMLALPYWENIVDSFTDSFNLSEAGGMEILGAETKEEVKRLLEIKQKRLKGRGTGAQIASGAGELILPVGAGLALMSSFPITGPVGPAVGARTIVSAVLSYLGRHGLLIAGTWGAGTAINYSTMEAEGVEESIRGWAAATRAGEVAILTALPWYRSQSILKLMAVNGSGTAVFGQLSTAIQNEVLKGYPELQREQFDVANMTVDALLGAGLSILFARIKATKGGGEAPKEGVSSSVDAGANKITDDIKWLPDGIPLPAPRNKGLPNSSKELPAPKKHVPTKSIAEAQKVANPKAAENEIVRIAMKNDVKVADTITDGAGIEALILDSALPNIPKSVGLKVDSNLNLSTTTRIIEAAKEMDYNIKISKDDNAVNPHLQNPTQREDLITEALNLRAEIQGGPVFSFSNSSPILQGIDNTQGRDIYLSPRGGTFKVNKNGEPSKQSLKELKKLQDRVDDSSLKGHGTLEFVKRDQGLVIEHAWKRKWEGTYGRLGVENIRMGMISANAYNRSSLASWFSGHGASNRLEHPHMQGIENEAQMFKMLEYNASKMKKELRSKKEKIVFNELITRGMDEGVNNFTLREIHTKYADLLSWKQSQNVYSAHLLGRKHINLLEEIANNQKRVALEHEGWQGIRLGGNNDYVGIGTTRISPEAMSNINSGKWMVMDYRNKVVSKYDIKNDKDRTLVKLKERIVIDGRSYSYASFGSEVRLGILPDQVMRSMDGWWPRKHTENFYIDEIPKVAWLNGEKIIDEKTLLEEFKTTISASRTINEGHEIAAELSKRNPDSTFKVRRERNDKVESFAQSMELASVTGANERRRGKQQLTDANGQPVRIADHYVSLKSLHGSLSHTEIFDKIDRIHQHDFVTSYPEFLPDSKFPVRIEDIRMPKDSLIPLEQLEIRFAEARRNYAYLGTQKELKDPEDFWIMRGAENAADWVEKLNYRLNLETMSWSRDIARGIPDTIRKIGHHGNPMNDVRSFASTIFISTAPLPQILIQGAQAREMIGVNPSALRYTPEMMSVRAIFLASENANIPNMKLVNMISKSTGLSADHLLKHYYMVQKSGLFDGLTKHELIKDAGTSMDAPLSESNLQEFLRELWETGAVPIDILRKWGFEVGERGQRLVMFYNVLDMKQKEFPNVDWFKPEGRAEISVEAFKLAGAMNRAAPLPTQRGSWAFFMQFTAPQHKIFINFMQSNGTILTRWQRARLDATRYLYYARDGSIIGGATTAFESFYNLLTDDENVDWFNEYPQLKNIHQNGFMDNRANRLLNLLTYDEDDPDSIKTDINFTEKFNPFTPHLVQHGNFIMELYKLVDNDPNSMPRSAQMSAVGRVWQTVTDLSRIWGTKGGTTQDNLRLSIDALGSMTSQWSNISKGILQYSAHKVISKNKFDIGIKVSTTESLARAWGLRTRKETDYWLSVDNDKQNEILKKDLSETLADELVWIINNRESNLVEGKMNTLGTLYDIILDGNPNMAREDMDDVFNMAVNRIEKMGEGDSGMHKLLAKLLDYHGGKIQGPWGIIQQRMLDSTNKEISDIAKAHKEGELN